MNLKAVTMGFLALLMFASCSDDDSSSSNCEAEDIGFLRLTIPSSTNRTAVLLTKGGSADFQEEIIPASQTSATFEVDSGTYTVAVDQINANGESVSETVSFGATIEQCETVEKTVVFPN